MERGVRLKAERAMRKQWQTKYALPFRNNQDGIYPLKFCDDADHRHYHDHQDVSCVYPHDRDQRTRVPSSSCSCAKWLATKQITMEF